MRPGIALRPDYDAARLRGLATAARDAGQSRRLLALAEIYDGGSRTRAARVGGVGIASIDNPNLPDHGLLSAAVTRNG